MILEVGATAPHEFSGKNCHDHDHEQPSCQSTFFYMTAMSYGRTLFSNAWIVSNPDPQTTLSSVMTIASSSLDPYHNKVTVESSKRQLDGDLTLGNVKLSMGKHTGVRIHMFMTDLIFGTSTMSLET